MSRLLPAVPAAVPESPIERLPLLALLAANAVSCVGTFMTLVALPWFVLETTGSAAKTGLTAMAVALPQVLAGFFAGALVDHLGYRRMSVLADCTAGLTVALVPLIYHLHGLAFWQLLVLVFLGNLLNAPGTTARQAMLPDLIRLAGMEAGRVNAWYQSTYNTGFLLGPVLAGVAITAIGTSNVLFLDAASFAFSAAVVALAVPVIAVARRAEGRYLDQVRAGVRFIAMHRLLLALALVTLIISFIGPAFQSVFLPVYARTLYGTPLALGVLRGAFGGGTLLGTLLYGLCGTRLPRRQLYLGLFLVSAFPIAVLLFHPPLAIAALSLLTFAAAFGPTIPLRVTIYQEQTPAVLRSRVFGTVGALQFAAAPVGTLGTGAALQQWGAIITLAILLAVWVLLVLGILLVPVFRAMNAQAEPATPTIGAGSLTAGPEGGTKTA